MFVNHLHHLHKLHHRQYLHLLHLHYSHHRQYFKQLHVIVCIVPPDVPTASILYWPVYQSPLLNTARHCNLTVMILARVMSTE